MGDRELTNWVNDQLYALLGYAEGSIAAYIVALGTIVSSSGTHVYDTRPYTYSICTWIFKIVMLMNMLMPVN
jgi:hypothetical protein